MTKEELFKEYRTACINYKNTPKSDMLYGKRQAIGSLLKRYYGVKDKELQAVLDEVNGANYLY